MGIDRISKLLAQGSRSRSDTRENSAQESTPATSEDATPQAAPDFAEKREFLFVQTYQSGTIASVAEADGRYTLTLNQGTGQTTYFSDRPERIVGSGATPQFLEGLGFSADNPPNAALVIETSPGESDVAVVELFNPIYDPVSHGVTYEVEVLGNWQKSLEMGFTEAPTDLSALAPSFGAAQLFIDDCSDGTVTCRSPYCHGEMGLCGSYGPQGYCFSWNILMCVPCEHFNHNNPDWTHVANYWFNRCVHDFPNCNGENWECEVEF